MKPYHKDFVFEKIKEYDNLITSRDYNNYRITKTAVKDKKLNGYMHDNSAKYNLKIIELLNGNTSLMKIDPREIEGCYEAVKFAKGRVGIVGLGLGYLVHEIAKKDEVDEVIVYEISEEVIKLYKENFKEDKKVKIIFGDAFKGEKQKFDFFFVDIYEYKLTSKVVEDYKKFNELHEIEEYSFWGMEHFLLSCNYEELLWVYIPENWVAMCKNMYEKLESSGYIESYKPLDEKKVSKILAEFKEVLNAGM